MAYLNFVDVSRYQGDINWQAVKDSGVVGTIIKISGGDDGLYYDQKANANYYGAKSVGLKVGGYHFAGHTDPTGEADFFVRGMQPLEAHDVLVLDYDSDTGDAPAWVLTFVNRVHDLTGVWPIVYVNGSTRNAHDWTAVAAHCGFWIAWYGKDPNGDLPVPGIYIMHQYTSSGHVNGISGNVDLDAVFMTPEQFDAYGFPETPPSPTPVPEPVPVPVIPDPIPEPTPDPVPVPEPGEEVPPTPEPTPTPEPWYVKLINIIVRAIKAAWNA